MKISRKVFDSYLAMIESSPGTKMFQHYYASFDGGEVIDTLEDGRASCAFYVSSILTIFKAVKSTHSTVGSVEQDMKDSGWLLVDAPEAGDVLIYEDITLPTEDEAVPHMGFYIGDEKAVSNSYTQCVPIVHDYKYRDFAERKIRTIYRGKHLMPDDIKEAK